MAKYMWNVLTVAVPILHTKSTKFTGKLDTTIQHTHFGAVEWILWTTSTTIIAFICRVHPSAAGHIPRLWSHFRLHFPLVRIKLWQCHGAASHYCTDEQCAHAIAMESHETDTRQYCQFLSAAATSKCFVSIQLDSAYSQFFFFNFSANSICLNVIRFWVSYSYVYHGHRGCNAIWPNGIIRHVRKSLPLCCWCLWNCRANQMCVNIRICSIFCKRPHPIRGIC